MPSLFRLWYTFVPIEHSKEFDLFRDSIFVFIEKKETSWSYSTFMALSKDKI